MTTNIPAIQGILGTTAYYMCSMKVGEFINKVIIPKEVPDWENLTVEERYQRKLDYNRVKKHIGPYLANDEDRFVGSFIVSCINPDQMEFKTLKDDNITLPSLYGDLASTIGNLIFKGGQILTPLDGQHRLLGFKYAVTGKDKDGNDLAYQNLELAREVVSLIIVAHDEQKSRKIFNKVNRYAKKTSTADDLITADDDIVAVINRQDIIDGYLDSRIVITGAGNTVPRNAKQFTTIKTTYDICGKIIENEANKKIDRTNLPSTEDRSLYRQIARDFWEEFLKITAYRDSVLDLSETGDEARIAIRAVNIHCKPIIMRALASAICILRSPNNDGNRLTLEECIRRIDTLDWNETNPLWKDVMIKAGNTVITGAAAETYAAKYLSYILGANLSDDEIKRIDDDYRVLTGGQKNRDTGEVIGGTGLPDPMTF